MKDIKKQRKKRKKDSKQSSENDSNFIVAEKEKLEGDNEKEGVENEKGDTESDNGGAHDAALKSKKRKRTKEERHALKLKKKESKKKILAQVPTTNEDGISYTKIQIRRMMRRVKHGLPPVPTEQEENERRRQIKLEKKEEEEELAGTLFDEDRDMLEVNEGNEEKEEDNSDSCRQVDTNEEGHSKNSNLRPSQEEKEVIQKSANASSITLKKKKRRSKPVPADYICLACQNAHTPLHWIYDCPNKIYRPGSNKVSKKARGLNDPTSNKVFVSGLPFSAKVQDVKKYFEDQITGAKAVHCKLILFEDTRRCKGQGIVTFDTEDSAKKALKLNGQTVVGFGGLKKDEKGGIEGKKKELRLGVKKVLNRTVTKGFSNS